MAKAVKSLVDFFAENPVEGIRKEVLVSTRLKDFPFQIKAMSYDWFIELRRQCTKDGHTDSAKFDKSVIIENCLSPNFRAAEDIERLGVRTPDEYIDKVLLIGEQMELSRQISDISGFNDNVEELRKEVKNS